MKRLVEVTIRYTTESSDENRNPITLNRDIKIGARLINNFSTYYYQGSEDRRMDKSLNIEIDKELLNNSETLGYILYDSKTYKVINILSSKDSDRKVILDCESIL